MIKVDIKVGDTVLGGRFKNKKIVVKKIGKNKKGDITINDKPLLKFRIIKEGFENDVVDYTKDLYEKLFNKSNWREYEEKLYEEFEAHYLENKVKL